MATIREALEQAVGLHRAGRTGEAMELYRDVLRREPENPDALHLLGIARLQGGAPAEAEPLLARAAAVRPKSAEFHAHHAQALTALGRQDAAAESWRRAADLAPADPGLWFALGNALGGQRRFADAALAFARAASLAPQVAEYRMAHGVALRNLGRLAEAEAAYRETLSRSPNLAEAHANLGVVLQQMRRLDEALDSYRRALALNPAFFRGVAQNLCTTGRGRIWLRLEAARDELTAKG